MCAWRVSRASPADLNKEILDEADQEEALGGFMASDASPLSLLTGGSAMPYSSNGTVVLSVGPRGLGGSAAPAGRIPSAIVNGQPVFSGTADPFGGSLRGSAIPVTLPFRSADRVHVASTAAVGVACEACRVYSRLWQNLTVDRTV